jgi:hypothetical protein
MSIEDPKPNKPLEQSKIDYRTAEEVRKDMIEKVHAGKRGELDAREQAAYDEQIELEREDDHPRYGHR